MVGSWDRAETLETCSLTLLTSSSPSPRCISYPDLYDNYPLTLGRILPSTYPSGKIECSVVCLWALPNSSPGICFFPSRLCSWDFVLLVCAFLPVIASQCVHQPRAGGPGDGSRLGVYKQCHYEPSPSFHWHICGGVSLAHGRGLLGLWFLRVLCDGVEVRVSARPPLPHQPTCGSVQIYLWLWTVTHKVGKHVWRP